MFSLVVHGEKNDLQKCVLLVETIPTVLATEILKEYSAFLERFPASNVKLSACIANIDSVSSSLKELMMRV